MRPGAPGLLALRALRGGGWNNPAENLRSANRNWNPARNRNDDIGFRLALSPANTLTRGDEDRPRGRRNTARESPCRERPDAREGVEPLARPFS